MSKRDTPETHRPSVPAGSAKRGPGRPPADHLPPTRQISILLPVELVEKARRIGDDNLTEGVRRAVRAYREKSI